MHCLSNGHHTRHRYSNFQALLKFIISLQILGFNFFYFLQSMILKTLELPQVMELPQVPQLPQPGLLSNLLAFQWEVLLEEGA